MILHSGTDGHTSEVHLIINPFDSIHSFWHHTRCGWICIYEKMTNLEVPYKWCFIIRLVSDMLGFVLMSITVIEQAYNVGHVHWLGMRFYCFKEEKSIQWSNLTFSCNILRLMKTDLEFTPFLTYAWIFPSKSFLEQPKPLPSILRLNFNSCVWN